MKPRFRVVVAGGREFSDYETLARFLDRLLKNKVDTHSIAIVSGCARGADKLGERYANERKYQLLQFPADWDRHGKSAGYKRNKVMAQNSDASAIFWDGQSKGTKHMIDLTQQYGNPLRICRY